MQLQKNIIGPTAAIAVISVIVFSVTGIGVMTRVIPSPISKSADVPATAAAPQAVAPVVLVAVKRPGATVAPKRELVHLVRAGPAPRAATSTPLKPGICPNCGSVVSIDVIQHEGEGTGPRTIATVVGISGGAYASHEIEKHANGANTYNVAVRMDDGSSRGFDYDAMPAYRAGDKVKVVEGGLVSR